METITTDVVVIGLGAFGSAALWRLAERGVDVVGIERQNIGHELGSSHGVTRVFRVACMEHPGLAPIARKSFELWSELSATTGETYVEQAGCLSTGAPRSNPVTGTRLAASRAGIPVKELSHAELLAEFPQYEAVDPGSVGVFDPEGGICFPERNVRAHVTAAREAGATVLPNTRVTDVELVEGGVRVTTPTVTIEAGQAVITAGAWNTKFLPDLPLQPRRMPMYWFAPKPEATADFDVHAFPAFIHEFPDGRSMWGHGSGDGFHIKIGPWDKAEVFTDTDAETVDRSIHPRGDIELISSWVAEAFPQIDPVPVKVIPCMVTNSPDHQFLVGRPRGDARLVMAGGDSGHGFKHAAGIGELLAQITVGEPTYTRIDFMDPDRFTPRGV